MRKVFLGSLGQFLERDGVARKTLVITVNSSPSSSSSLHFFWLSISLGSAFFFTLWCLMKDAFLTLFLRAKRYMNFKEKEPLLYAQSRKVQKSNPKFFVSHFTFNFVNCFSKSPKVFIGWYLSEICLTCSTHHLMTNYLFRGEGRCSGETAPKWSKAVVKKSRKNPKRKGDISQFCSSSFRRKEVWNPFFSDNCPLKSTVPFTIAYPRCFSYPY